MKTKTARTAAMFISVIFGCIILWSYAFTAIEASHDCRGESCVVCEISAVCRHLLGEHGIVPAAVAAAAVIFFIMMAVMPKNDVSGRTNTLISLKVELLD